MRELESENLGLRGGLASQAGAVSIANPENNALPEGVSCEELPGRDTRVAGARAFRLGSPGCHGRSGGLHDRARTGALFLDGLTTVEEVGACAHASLFPACFSVVFPV
jgi:hypothetical protein